jgi:hypothetical protein
MFRLTCTHGTLRGLRPVQAIMLDTGSCRGNEVRRVHLDGCSEEDNRKKGPRACEEGC